MVLKHNPTQNKTLRNGAGTESNTSRNDAETQPNTIFNGAETEPNTTFNGPETLLPNSDLILDLLTRMLLQLEMNQPPLNSIMLAAPVCKVWENQSEAEER